MAPQRRAIIDVGTNSVKLLVADVVGNEVSPLFEKSEQTRLGQGFYQEHRLQTEAIQRTAAAVGGFVKVARRFEAESLRVIATSAARDARNPEELRQAVEAASQLAVEIISGEQEAEWVFLGVTTDSRLQGMPLMILDVGGGSTEMILGQRGHHTFSQSIPVGSVRMMETLPPADPPSASDLERCRAHVKGYYDREIGPPLAAFRAQPPGRPMQLVGTGGTATILARIKLNMTGFVREQLDGLRLDRADVLGQVTTLWSQSLEQRRKIVGLPPNRADIILMGAVIYETVLTHSQTPDLCVSTRGLRYGAVLE